MNKCAVIKTVMLPWALLCLHTVCWWCLHCWPTWSDKSCSIWEGEAAQEASHPAFSAVGRKETFLHGLTVTLSLFQFTLHLWERSACIQFHELLNLHLYLLIKCNPKFNPRWMQGSCWITRKLKIFWVCKLGCQCALRSFLLPLPFSAVQTSKAYC